MRGCLYADRNCEKRLRDVAENLWRHRIDTFFSVLDDLGTISRAAHKVSKR
jgi:hypothetical protein